LGDAESLHIYRNGVIVYLQPESAQVLLPAVEAVCKLVEQLPEYSDLSGLRIDAGRGATNGES
jgi:hypothetical protein